jgi:single-strand DNA-binding protein
MHRVSYFYTNAQFLGILFCAVLLRLFRVDSTPTNMDASVAEGLMNCFTLTAVGHMARNPEVIAKGEVACTRFCLIGNDYAGKDDEGAAREVTTSLWFVAFGAIGDSIAQHSRKGDQLIVEARVRSNNWTDKQGERQYDHSFVVQGFRFGAPGKAKREERDGRREQTLGLPRPEDRGNSRERAATQALNGGSGSHDGRSGGVSDEDAGNGHDGVGGEGVGAGSDPGVADTVPGDARSAVEIREPPGVNGSADAHGRPGESGAVGVGASLPAKVTQEKARGSRSSRKPAASAA